MVLKGEKAVENLEQEKAWHDTMVSKPKNMVWKYEGMKVEQYGKQLCYRES